ncbi:pre-16S rRNA-processing nuclease YqgF [Candidatus Gracilibacteria bacterium]|nr:pre-16S rRNA-processing nuclease YqgF [Candidatus Gracilibacteria bacterium]
MNYGALDVGDKRVGIAISEQNIAFSHKTVPRVEIISFLKKFFGEYQNIETMIVGLPFDLYGKDMKQLDKTQKFIKKLESIFPEIEFIGHDERFSSFVADEGFSTHRDDIAAQCILQSYIDTKKLK